MPSAQDWEEREEGKDVILLVWILLKVPAA